MKRRLVRKIKKQKYRDAERKVIEAATRFSKFTGGPIGIFDALTNLAKTERP